MMRTTMFRSLMVTGLLLSAPVVGAETEAPCIPHTSREEVEAAIVITAQELDRDALALMAAGRWHHAQASLLAAWRTHRDPEIALHLGLVEIVLGRPREAAEPLTFYVEEVMFGIFRPAPAPKVSPAIHAWPCPTVELMPGITHIEGAPEF